MSATRHTFRRAALTLAELVIAMTVMTLVFGALMSALVIATQALPTDNGRFAALATGRDLCQRLRDELLVATDVVSAKDRVVTFVIPDRTGDGQPDEIAYLWADGALKRSRDGAVLETVLRDVSRCVFTYQTELRSREIPSGTYTHTAGSVVDLLSFSGSAAFGVDTDDWIGQYIEINLPTNAVSWRPLVVFFRAQANGLLNSVGRLEVQGATADEEPSGDVLAWGAISESALSYTPTNYALFLSATKDLDPADAVCVVIRGTSGDDLGNFFYHPAPRADPTGSTGHLVYSNDGDDDWEVERDRDFIVAIWAEVTLENPPLTEWFQVVTAVHADLTVGPDDTRLTAAFETLNRPEDPR